MRCPLAPRPLSPRASIPVRRDPQLSSPAPTSNAAKQHPDLPPRPPLASSGVLRSPPPRSRPGISSLSAFPLSLFLFLDPPACLRHLLRHRPHRQRNAVALAQGFDFPFNLTKYIPFYGGAEYHDYHHYVTDSIRHYKQRQRTWSGGSMSCCAWCRRRDVALRPALTTVVCYGVLPIVILSITNTSLSLVRVPLYLPRYLLILYVLNWITNVLGDM
ncbi:hypothetical protein ABZP36_028720 [Zizania latifolia]